MEQEQMTNQTQKQKPLKDELFEYRVKNNLSLKKMAELTGISVGTISLIERGKKANRKTEQMIRWVCEGVLKNDNL